MNISKIIIRQGDTFAFSDGIEVNYEICYGELEEKLWFRIYGPDCEQINPNCNAALIAMLIPAMSTGQDIEVHGEISKLLFTNVSGDVQSLLNIYDPSWKKISVRAEKIVENKSTNRSGCGTGFSAGIDSFGTLSQYSNRNDDRLYVTHVFNFDVGAMGRFDEKNRDSSPAYMRFLKYKKRLEIYAKNESLEPYSVSSNLDYFYSKIGLGFQKTCTIRNVATALLFDDVVSYYLYSSAFGPEYIEIKKNYDISYMDPVILPLLGTESMRFFSSGMSFTRFDKVKAVSEFVQSYEWLDVCVNQKNNSSGYNNCTKCWKCVRTIMDLEVIGKLESYSKVFDLNYYHCNKARAQRIVFKRAALGSSIDKDTVKRSKAQGYCEGYWVNIFIASVHRVKVKLRRVFKDFL